MQEIATLMITVTDRIGQTDDVVAANGWMQLHSLLTRVEDNMTNGRLHGEYGTAVRYLVQGFANLAFSYFEKVFDLLRDDQKVQERQVSYWQHQIIERLCNEWETLLPLFSPIKEPHFTILKALINEAKPRGNRINDQLLMTIPYTGRRFELRTFDYAPNVFVVGIPIDNLDTPWNWQVIWHEMAGHIVRQLEWEIDNQILERLPEDTWDSWHMKYVAQQVPNKADWLENVDQTGWLAELIEDGFSVLTLGPVIIRTLQRVLQQHYEDDDAIRDERHPTPQLRFDMAGALLLEMGFPLDGLGLELDDCEALRPIARIIHNLLMGNGDQGGFLGHAQVFTMEMQAVAIELGAKLLSNQQVKITSYRPLIAATRFAVESAPDKAQHVFARAKNAIRQTYQIEQALAAIDLEEGYFTDLVALGRSETWQDLLSRQFSATDFASPRFHSHADNGLVTVTFWNADHGTHSWTHRH